MNSQSDRERQIEIYRLIAKNPGIYLSKIAELINIKIDKIEQNLNFLEKNNIVTVVEDFGFKRYYVEKKGMGTRAGSAFETQEKIYKLIEKNPGLHLSKIAEMLQMRISLTEYHLIQLEQNKKIISQKDEKGYYKRYYTEDTELGIENKKLLVLLRQDIPSMIISLLLKHSYLQHKDLLTHFDTGPSTLSYHLRKLVDQGFIEVRTHGEEKGYFLKNKKEITDFLLKYEFTSWLKNFKDIWRDFSS